MKAFTLEDFKKWGRKGGKAKSKRKAEAARENSRAYWENYRRMKRRFMKTKQAERSNNE